MRKLFASAICLCYAVPAMAFSCTGTVTHLAVDTAGAVFIDNGNGILAVCSVSSQMGAVTPEACTAWYSGFLTARASSQPVTIYFNPSDISGITTCETLGTWVTRTPYYVQFT